MFSHNDSVIKYVVEGSDDRWTIITEVGMMPVVSQLTGTRAECVAEFRAPFIRRGLTCVEVQS